MTRLSSLSKSNPQLSRCGDHITFPPSLGDDTVTAWLLKWILLNFSINIWMVWPSHKGAVQNPWGGYAATCPDRIAKKHSSWLRLYHLLRQPPGTTTCRQKKTEEEASKLDRSHLPHSASRLLRLPP